MPRPKTAAATPTRSARNSGLHPRGIRRPRSAGTPRLPGIVRPGLSRRRPGRPPRLPRGPHRSRQGGGGILEGVQGDSHKKGVTSLVWLVGVIASLAVLGLAVKLGLPVAGLVQGKVP